MKKWLSIFLICGFFVLCLGCEQEVCGCLPPEKEQPKKKQEAVLLPQTKAMT